MTNAFDVIAAKMKPQIVVVGSRVYDGRDPRHVGKVQDILAGVALVQWGWRGKLSLLRLERLVVAT